MEISDERYANLKLISIKIVSRFNMSNEGEEVIVAEGA